MKTFRNLFLVLSFYFISACGLVYSQDQKTDFTSQWDTVRVLKNPYKGWYHHLLDDGISSYAVKDDSLFASFPGMDHVYLRIAWSYLEPKEGEFDWSYIDRVVEKYVPKGYNISFCITCSETGCYPNSVGEQFDGVQYATPSWVKKDGAKGTIVDLGPNKNWVPKWGDRVFLEKLDQFHRAFAARYDGKPWVSYVDIGSVGEWGEGHTDATTKIPPTVSEVKANVDVFLKNYKKSQLLVSDDLLWYGKTDTDIKTLYNYVTSNGISLRDDSPMVEGYIKYYLPTWTLFHPEFYDPLYLQKPIVLETEHYVNIKRNGFWLGKNGEIIIPDLKVSGADIFRGVMKTMHPTYIGYHGYVEDWLADNPDLARELANRCGYWYFPVKSSVPGNMVKGENSISMEWLNKGVAPAYNVFSLILRFEAKNPKNSFDLLIKDSGNKNWLPGKIEIEKYLFAIPSKAPKGQYMLMFKLVDQANVEQEIKLGLNKKIIGNQEFINLEKVYIE